MLGLSFAAEPLYSTFCRITGFGGTTQVAVKAPGRVLDRTVRVRFDANVDPAAPLSFRAVEPYIEARLGETVLGFYEVTNTSEGPVAAMASYNVAPHKAGVYFNKIECFCFKKKIFQPGVSERLPVIFYVSPDMADDRLSDDVRSITLSYTYFLADDVPKTARLEDASAVY
jgi:cytochrome c oxidase assembly protein subunit 11